MLEDNQIQLQDIYGTALRKNFCQTKIYSYIGVRYILI